MTLRQGDRLFQRIDVLESRVGRVLGQFAVDVATLELVDDQSSPGRLGTDDAPRERLSVRAIIDQAHPFELAHPMHFTFEAVVLYLIRWEILYRWTRRDAAAGQQKFDQLVAEAMGEYAEMWK